MYGPRRWALVAMTPEFWAVIAVGGVVVGLFLRMEVRFNRLHATLMAQFEYVISEVHRLDERRDALTLPKRQAGKQPTTRQRILGKHGYPPDKQEAAARTVLEQAEELSVGWAI